MADGTAPLPIKQYFCGSTIYSMETSSLWLSYSNRNDPNDFIIVRLGCLMNNKASLRWLTRWKQASKKRNQLLFIASETRSGSTWLSYVLGTHPWAAHLGEYYRPFLQPGHVPCRLCAGRGLTECQILGDLSQIPIQHAYSHALDRYQALNICTLIDCSKDLGWLEQVLSANAGSDDNNVPVKIIHLIRDPRGWAASERRRVPMSISEATDRWLKNYNSTKQWIEAKGIPSICISYDQLCLQPEISLRRLSRFIGNQ